MSDVEAARKQGYAPAIVVSEFKNGAKIWEENGVKWIPCPSQINEEKMTCVKCRLCFKDQFLKENNMGIAFQSHGSNRNKINKRLLNVIQ